MSRGSGIYPEKSTRRSRSLERFRVEPGVEKRTRRRYTNCDARCWNATSPPSACRCSCGGAYHGGYRRLPSLYQQAVNQQKRDEIAKALVKKARDEAVNRILQKVELSAVVTQPHITLTIEIVRQSYNHRDYLYDVAKELSSSDSTDQKFSNIRDRTVQELKKEAMSRLATGGVTAVSSGLRDMGVFTRPFGLKGPVLNENQSRMLQTFFEGTLNQLSEEQ